MFDTNFLNTLKNALPSWVEKQWVTQKNAKLILQDVEQNIPSRNFTGSLVIVGVILLGLGIILFFAANWSSMSKLLKLTICIGSLCIAHASAYCYLKNDAHSKLGHAFVLLSIILFGANIMLIAQMYHITSHFPDGILIWLLGALLTSVLLNSKSAMSLCFILITLWTLVISDQRIASLPHWWYLAPWSVSIYFTVKNQWKSTTHIGAISFITWFFISITELSMTYDEVKILQIGFLFFLVITLLITFLTIKSTSKMNSPIHILKRYASIICLLHLYIFTFPEVFVNEHDTHHIYFLIFLLLTTIALFLMLSFWQIQISLIGKRYFSYAALLLSFLLMIFGFNLSPVSLVNAFVEYQVVGINLIYFLMLFWLISFGHYYKNHFLINMAFFFLALGVIGRYFDTFWGLLDRSLFFISGGVLLLILGATLEKNRKKYLKGVTTSFSPEQET